MHVSMKWLSELVPVDITAVELADRLDMTGTAVEAVTTAGEPLDGVVVGLIAEKVKHPEADKLWVTTVDVGTDTPRTIVCGAQNFDAGDKVPVALVGAVLPGGFAIKKAKLRGVVSEGMNCSASELGLGEDSDGLMILPSDAPVGEPFAEWYGLADTVLELEVTPNRPDCLSMVGVAREVGAVLDVPSTRPGQVPEESGGPTADLCAVNIRDEGLCPRYTARVIRDVKIGPSPKWLAEKVIAAGARPINNIVDVTNYVMFELGQPLHAFDLNTITKDTTGRASIIVRRAEPGEVLTTLDGVKRQLNDQTLVIADPEGAIALAGVMGGEDTEVSDQTVDILLEAASFDPATTSRTSRSLGLISEASLRFERTVDRSACVEALDRAAALMAEVAGGAVTSGVIDEYPRPLISRSLTLRLERLHQVLGVGITPEEASGILARLGCGVTAHQEHIKVDVPSFRPDLEREIDLVEEVLRIWGMEDVEASLPTGAGRIGGLTIDQRRRSRLGEVLRACGLNETMTYAFTDPADFERMGMVALEGELPVEVLNPMSVEQSELRRTLMPGLLRSVSYNQRRGVGDVHLYEIGSVFRAAAGRKQPKEREMIAGVLAGSWGEQGWNQQRVSLDFFDGKGVLENLARELAVGRFAVRPIDLAWLQPGRSAEVLCDGSVIGWLGEIHPSTLEVFEAEPAVVAFELQVATLLKAARDARPFREVPRFPSVDLDLALVVDEEVSAERIEDSLRSAGGKLLEDVRLFDVYRGKGVPEGKKSMAFSLHYRSVERTLTAEEVENAHSRLVRKVTGAVGAEVRG